MKTGAILIVDDNPVNLDVLVETLSDAGFDLAVAMDGEGALEQAPLVRPDLILLDVQMPGIDGFETCRRLKDRPEVADIPVIFMTALAETEDKVRGFNAGAVDYITKPFQREEVLARVHTHLTLRAVQRRLEDANHRILEQTRRKSEFLASMSHELRTPMNAILGFTRLVLRRSGHLLPEKDQDNLGKVRESADYLLNLVNSILDLSKIEAGRMDVSPGSFDVKGFVQKCCDTISPLVQSGVGLTFEVAEEIGEAHTDREMLRQMLINLLSNAVKFTEQGEISVRVNQASDDVLVIAVSDTGVGIPEDSLETIFEEFQQIQGEHQKQKGTGLGLSITKGRAELLGGGIEVESEEGKGSTFTVKVPRVYRENAGSGERPL